MLSELPLYHLFHKLVLRSCLQELFPVFRLMTETHFSTQAAPSSSLNLPPRGHPLSGIDVTSNGNRFHGHHRLEGRNRNEAVTERSVGTGKAGLRQIVLSVRLKEPEVQPAATQGWRRQRDGRLAWGLSCLHLGTQFRRGHSLVLALLQLSCLFLAVFPVLISLSVRGRY